MLVEVNTERSSVVSIRVDREKLREARELALLSQQELADEAGISVDTVKRMESGEGSVYGRTVRRVASVLGVDPRELLEGAEGKALARR